MNKNTIKEFTDLEGWKVSHQLVIDIYVMTMQFPKEEKYGLTSQLRRAAVSITANIAEGFSRYHYKEKIHFYYTSRGSISEVQDLLLIARDIGTIDETKMKFLFDCASRSRQLVNGMIRSLQSKVNIDGL